MKLVKIDKGTSVSLTDQGIKMAQAILEEGEALREEAGFLSEVAPRMTDALMKRVWRLPGLKSRYEDAVLSIANLAWP
ncbi:hypothetical protein [Phyllobacterium salinisoli]|uniref:hypothetical protein n=1 Tax=Phyllobacterium salinisoli TaxID=1899321 RepID=UPI001FDEAEAA|nr:hypothetical protein [Phyllobacterium salinisoli]